MKIISGGQTGADRAALDAAISLGMQYGGWLPQGRKTEDGPLPGRYLLEELDSDNYRDRTEKNVLASDGTLIVTFGSLCGGSALTESLALRHERPCLIIDFDRVTRRQAKQQVENWLKKNSIAVLNVAGPRASREPRIYNETLQLLLSVSWPDTA